VHFSVERAFEFGDVVVTATDGYLVGKIELVDDRNVIVPFGGDAVRALANEYAAATDLEKAMRFAMTAGVRVRLVDALLAGRADPTAIFDSLRRVVPIPTSVDPRLCDTVAGQRFLSSISTNLCATRDIARDRSLDNLAIPAPCSRISFALPFDTVPAYPGRAEDLIGLPRLPCPLFDADGGKVPDAALGAFTCPIGP
jgi:hypothetical protein